MSSTFIRIPGEIIIPDNLFYTFEEKYSKDSTENENDCDEELSDIEDSDIA